MSIYLFLSKHKRIATICIMARQAKACEICTNFSARSKLSAEQGGDVSIEQRRLNLGLLAAAFVGHISMHQNFPA